MRIGSRKPLALVPLVMVLSLHAPVHAGADAPPTALRVPGPLSPRNASYQISCRLDEQAHTVSGTLRLSFRNLERHPADRLVFHLYLNAFKNFASTFIREAGPRLRGDDMPERGFGAIDVSRVRAGKHDLTGRAVVDDTLMTVPLPEPLGPSAAIEVEMAFVSKLPRVFARSGYAGEFHAVAQWFPKVGVWSCEGDACRWRAAQYHGSTEFFADYGSYDVTIDAPAHAIVGASGVLIEETLAGPRRVLRYLAEDVHDFVFMSDPRFIEVKDRLADAWGEVQIRLLTRRGLEDMTPRHLLAVKEGLLELERRFGVYPYKNVTVVIPPWDAKGAGGMEYPTLFTGVPVSAPAGITFSEAVTAHELGHQYFYGILGSDEVEEAWLDEGLNDTFTTWAIERMYGKGCNAVRIGPILGLCLSILDESWLEYRRTLRRAPVATPGYRYPPGTYSGVTYSQTAITLRTLERYLGSERMERAMRRYAERYRFRHPQRADFVAAMSEGAGEDLRWFFGQTLETTRVADYEVLRAITRPHLPPAGLWECPPGPLPSDPEAQALYREAQDLLCPGKAPGRYELDPKRDPRAKKVALHESEVYVQRRGDLIFPITIEMTFRDGSTVRETWGLAEQQAAPELRTRRYHYPRRAAPLERVVVDPEGILLLDEKRLNNGLTLRGGAAPLGRVLGTWLGLLQTFISFLGP